jgi:hypothetical protein
MMTTGITVDLSKRLIPAVAAGTIDLARRENAWLIRGEFTRVNQAAGSCAGRLVSARARRNSRRAWRSTIYRPAIPNRFLTFSTTGGSNAEPGAIPTLATDPLSLVIEAAGGAGNVAHGVTEDTKRTAREITAELSDYMYRSRWIPEDKWIQPKAYSQLMSALGHSLPMMLNDAPEPPLQAPEARAASSGRWRRSRCA